LNAFFVDPRKEKYVIRCLGQYMMISYVEENYPDPKLLRKTSNIWGLEVKTWLK